MNNATSGLATTDMVLRAAMVGGKAMTLPGRSNFRHVGPGVMVEMLETSRTVAMAAHTAVIIVILRRTAVERHAKIAIRERIGMCMNFARAVVICVMNMREMVVRLMFVIVMTVEAMIVDTGVVVIMRTVTREAVNTIFQPEVAAGMMLLVSTREGVRGRLVDNQQLAIRSQWKVFHMI